MTINDFQKKYHSYRTNSKKEAKAECAKINAELVNASVHFPKLGYTLMLDTTIASGIFKDVELEEEKLKISKSNL